MTIGRWFAGLITLWMVPAVICAAEGKKKLVEFGWDEPDTQFMREHITEMEKTPFDGCVFTVKFVTSKGQKGRFTWEGWSNRSFEFEDLTKAVEDLKATKFNRFTENFLRFNTTPAKLDWFDDYSAVINNARIAARAAREGGCRGILFDIEQYEGKLFSLKDQRDAKTKGWDGYSKQVRLRGKQVMEAFQEGYPDLTVFMTFGYSLPWATGAKKIEGVPQGSYGLLAPFMDGLIEGAKGKTRIVDGHELTYAFKDRPQFEKQYQETRNGLGKLVAEPQKYQQFISIGFGVWMDDDWRRKGWNEADPSKNYFSPEGFEKSVTAALETSDEYVWIYTETPRWWGDKGRVKLPQAYEDALRRAKVEANK